MEHSGGLPQQQVRALYPINLSVWNHHVQHAVLVRYPHTSIGTVDKGALQKVQYS